MSHSLLDVPTSFIQGCPRKHIFIHNSTHTPCNLCFEYILVFQKAHSLFNSYLGQMSCRKFLISFWRKHYFAFQR